MCYNLSQQQRSIEKRLRYKLGINYVPPKAVDLFTVSGFSHPDLWVISSTDPSKVSIMRWGLIPSWCKENVKAKELSNQCLNARAETVFEKPSFRSILKRRCVLPVNGFFEWQTRGKEKVPHYIYRKDMEPLYLGCLFDICAIDGDGPLPTFSILTTEANPMMAEIHNAKKRMPLILPDVKLGTFLDTSLSQKQIAELLEPFDESLMAAHTISKLITSRSENPNTEKVLEPHKYN